MARRQRFLVAMLGALPACLLSAAGAAALEAKAPGERQARGMKIRFTPKRGPAGTTFRGVARGFARGEPVTAEELARGRSSSRLPGGSASRDGRVRVLRRTLSNSKPGARKLCLRGERSRRVACGRYRVTPGAGPEEEDLVLEEENESHQDTEDGEDLQFDGGDLLDLEEAPDPPGAR